MDEARISLRMDLATDYVSKKLEKYGYFGKTAGDFYWMFLEYSDLYELIHDDGISDKQLQAIWQRKFEEWLVKQPTKEQDDHSSL